MATHTYAGLSRRDAAAALLASGPEAQRVCKELVRRVAGAPDGADDYTAALIARVRSSHEGREGIRAFLEERDPARPAEVDV